VQRYRGGEGGILFSSGARSLRRSSVEALEDTPRLPEGPWNLSKLRPSTDFPRHRQIANKESGPSWPSWPITRPKLEPAADLCLVLLIPYCLCPRYDDCRCLLRHIIPISVAVQNTACDRVTGKFPGWHLSVSDFTVEKRSQEALPPPARMNSRSHARRTQLATPWRHLQHSRGSIIASAATRLSE
jgi:hypothetical protein